MDNTSKEYLQSNRNQAILLISALAVIAGSVGPWAHVWIVTVNGTSGDGVLSLIAGAVAGVLAFLEFSRSMLSRGRNIGMLLLFGGSAALGGYHWLNLESLVTDSMFPAAVGWGLPVLTIAGVIGAVTSFVQLGRVNEQSSSLEAHQVDANSDF